MKCDFDRRKSLQELEQEAWGEPAFDSHLVTTVHQLRRKALAEFTVEELRILIGQNVSLPFLIPLALERLAEDPLAEGDFYPGDLLYAVLHVDEAFRAGHPEVVQRVCKIVERVRALLPSLDVSDRPKVAELLREASHLLKE